MDPKKVAFLADSVADLTKRFDAMVEEDCSKKDAGGKKKHVVQLDARAEDGKLLINRQWVGAASDKADAIAKAKAYSRKYWGEPETIKSAREQ